MKVAIIDYGIGNLGSVRRALSELGAEPAVVDHPKSLDDAGFIILPGVGSFSDGMKQLHQAGWVEAIRYQVSERGKALLGICLGMQLLASGGEEGAGAGQVPGLDLIDGEVVRLDKLGCTLRIPHVGWNSIAVRANSALLAYIPDDTNFYFVHSYAFKVKHESDIHAVCNYGKDFAAVVGRGRVWGTQFHPEKSSRAGFRVLRNFLELPPC